MNREILANLSEPESGGFPNGCVSTPAALRIGESRGKRNMKTIQTEGSTNPVKFFPIFLGATLAAMIDSAQVLIDETVIGNLFDDAAFGAVNLLEPYLLLEEFVSYLICVGGTALLVRARGAKNTREMPKLYNHCVTCCLIAGLTFCTLYSLFDEQLVSLVARDSAAYPIALRAFYWDRFNSFVTPLYDFLYTYTLYFNGALFSSISMLVKLGVNTALSVYLGVKIGIAGVTCATLIANCAGLSILCLYILVKHRGFHYRPYVNPGTIKTLTLLSLPESSFFLSIFILEAGVNTAAMRQFSIRGVAVAAVLINLYEVVAFMSEGISEYETAAVNWALGEKNREELQHGMRVTFRAVLMESVFFSLLFLLAAPRIIRLFDIDDAEAAKSAITAVRVLAVSPAAIITTRVTAIFYQYTEKIGRAILVWVFFLGVVPLLLAAFLSLAGLSAMVWGVALGPVIAVALLWTLPTGRKRSAGVDLRRTTVVFRDGFLS